MYAPAQTCDGGLKIRDAKLEVASRIFIYIIINY